MRRISSFLWIGIVLIIAFSLMTCSDDNPAQSETEPTETITTPAVPNGPGSGNADESLSFSVGGSASNLGHTVDYRFVWAEGDTSAWSASTTVDHSWLVAGTYSVKAQARCATHATATSSWSEALVVTIQVCDYEVTGPTSGEVWRKADNETISWNSNNAGDTVRIELYKGFLKLCDIDSCTANDGSYQWLVDDWGGGSDDNYRIKVTDIKDGECYDYSSYFEIDAGPWVVSLSPVADATVYSLGPDMNFGDELNLCVGNAGAYGMNSVSYITFDLSTIPSDAVIEDAFLRGYVRFLIFRESVLYAKLGACSEPWSEMDVTWNDDITVDAIGAQIVSFIRIEENTWKKFDVKSFVQSWMTGQNYGLAFYCDEYGVLEDFVYLDSRESSFPAVLEITYSLP